MILPNLNNITHCGESLHTGILPDTNDEIVFHRQSYFLPGPPLVESTISRNSAFKSRETQIETKLHPDTGLQYPYNIAVKFLSRFLFGCKGCYNCGKMDDNSTHAYKLVRAGNFDEKIF